jgi:short-subunit dehydrogenase
MKDNVTLLTGASSGIGAALARELSRRGAILVVAARRTDRLEALVDELEAAGGRALAVACDVTQEGDLERAVATAVAAFGRLDTVIANAGFGVAGAFERLSVEDYRRQFDTNVYGVLRTVAAALPELKKTRGRVAVVGSVAGYIATPMTSAYAMSKFAVRALCDSLHVELGRDGVSVTHIAPGFVASEIRAVDNQGHHHAGAKDPLPPWLVASAESAAVEIARAIARRKRERVVTFHGKVLVWFGRHAPWLLRPLLGRSGGARRPPNLADQP